VMEDEEGGQSSGWEIVCAFAERGELPYKDEAKVSLFLELKIKLMVDYRICYPSCIPPSHLDVQGLHG